MSKHLTVLMGHHPNQGADLRRPFPHEVVYAQPNLDGTRKQCANCMMYEAPAQLCAIHDTDVIISPDMVCGYHVYGRPVDGADEEHRQYMDPVLPELSGLELITGGTSCDTCEHYVPTGTMSGQCEAVADPDEPSANYVVAPLGCCARWSELCQ